MSESIDYLTGEIIETTRIPLGVMPPEIAAAIVKVMGQVKRLGKEGNNTFQRYQFTSVDQFYEAVGPLMAEAGIFTLLFENEMDISKQETTSDRGETKTAVWLSAKYDVYIFHATGKSYGPIPRTTKVLASGPQSFAAAMSFVDKYFLRSLLKISTGDVDADADTSDRRDLPHRNASRAPSPHTNPTQDQTPPYNQFISTVQADELARLLRLCGRGTWEHFAAAMKVERFSVIPADKYEGAVSWLNGRLQIMSANNGKPPTPPNPNAAVSVPPKPVETPFDFDGYRQALATATTPEEADAAYEMWVDRRQTSMTDTDIEECSAMLRETCDRLYVAES